MGIKVPWTRHEAVILLNAYILMAEGKMSRQATIRSVSMKLRQMGINKGIEIDPIYRNENGITFQMHAMESAYRGENIIKPATKLFIEVVKLYKDNPDMFSRLLKEAETMADDSCNQETQFMTWLANQVTPAQLSEMYMAFKEIEQFARKERLVNKSLFRQIDLTTVKKIRRKIGASRQFKLTHKKQLGIIFSALNYLSAYLEKSISGMVAEESSQKTHIENEQRTSQEKVSGADALKESQENQTIEIEKEEPRSETPMINDQNGFYHWLLDVQHMADATCRSYISAISTIEKYAKEHNLSDVKLYLASFSEIERISTALLQDHEFLRYNAIQHNRFHAAVSKYLDYCRDLLVGHKAIAEGKSETVEMDAHQKQMNRLGAYSDALYNRLYAMSQVYRDPQGLTVERIQKIVGGTGLKNNIIGILESVDWAILVAPSTYSFNKDAVPYIRVTLDDFDQGEYIKVLMVRYQSGMQFDSIDFDTFRDTYEDLFDEEISCDDKELEARLRLCGLYYNGRLFPIDGIIPPDIREKLFSYIEANFNKGKQVIYYKAIYADMSEDFAYCFSLTDDHMLRAFIEYTAPEGKYYFYNDYMATEEGVEVDHSEEITEFLLSAGKPMTYEEIYQGLSHISQKIIHDEIRSNKAYVMDAKARYFHIGIFEIDEDDKEIIKKIISSEILENGYALWNKVYSRINDEAPVFLENNLYLSSLGLRNAIAIHLKDYYDFDYAIISPKGKKLSMTDIYRLYAQTRRRFTESDLYSLSKELDTGIYFSAVSAVSVRVSRELFIPKDDFHVDIRGVDHAIGTYLIKDYIPVKEIDSFLIFPNVGYEWNKFLLESYLMEYSRQYMLLNNGLSLNNVAGVVVRRNGPLHNFNDACALALADSGIELKKDKALNYLAEMNFVSKRSYRDLDIAIQKAIRIRNGR